jgi:hypothetical protein
MKIVIFFFGCLALCNQCLFAQSELEVSTGYGVNKNLADGIVFHIGYDYKLYKSIRTKTQFGSKYLYHYNDFVGAKIANKTYELHQTVSYNVIEKNRYILKPNIGLNYRFFFWKGKMRPPLNSLPQRQYTIHFRNNESLRLNSFDGDIEKKYKVSNIGYTFQIENQFKIKNGLWLLLTPFIEVDYDKTQSIGGVYFGIVFK